MFVNFNTDGSVDLFKHQIIIQKEVKNALQKLKIINLDNVDTLEKLKEVTGYATDEFFNFAKQADVSGNIVKQYKKYTNAASNGISTFTMTLKGLVSTLKTVALNMVIVAGVSAIISGATKLLNMKKEAREQAIENAKAAKEEANNLTELLTKYNHLSEEVKTNSDAKDTLIATQNDLLKSLGIEQSQLDFLIQKYGDLSTAINQVTLDKLKEAQSDLLMGYNGYKEELLKAGKGSWLLGDKNIIPAAGKKSIKAFEVLEEAGIINSNTYGTGGGHFILTGDTSTVEGVLENYEKLKEAQGALNEAVFSGKFTKEELASNPLYNAIGKRIKDLKSQVDNYNTAISDVNINSANQQIISSLMGKELPKSQEEFEQFKQSIIDASKDSGNFIGTQADIENAIIDSLAKMQEFKQYFNDLTTSKNSFDNPNKTTFFTDEQIKSLAEFQASIKNIQSALQDTSKLDSSSILDLMKEHTDFDWVKFGITGKEGVGDLAGALKSLAQHLYNSQDATLQQNEGVKDLLDTTLTMTEVNDRLTKSLSDLEAGFKLQETVNKEFETLGYISANTLNSIIAKYPELEELVAKYNSKLATTDDILNALKGAYDKDFNNYKDSTKAKLMLSEDFYKNVFNNISDEVKELAKSYKIDLDNYSSAQKAKLEIATQLAEKQKLLEGVSSINESEINVFGVPKTIMEKNLEKKIEERIKQNITEIEEISNSFNTVIGNIFDSLNFEEFNPSVSDNKKDKSSSQVIDWISRKLEVVKTQLDTIKKRISDSTLSYKLQNKEIENASKLIKDQISIYEKAENKYRTKADNVGLSKSLQNLVQNGSYDITKYDEEAAKKIEDYKKWYDEAEKLKVSISELRQEEADLLSQSFDNKVGHYTNLISNRNNKIQREEAKIDLKDAKGKNVTEKDYKKIIDYHKKNIVDYEKEYNDISAEIDRLLAKDKNFKNSDDYFKLIGDKVNAENNKANEEKLLLEAEKAPFERNFNNLEKQLDSVTNKYNSLSSKIQLTGDFLDGDSIEQIVLLQTGYESSKKSLEDLAKEKKNLDKAFKNGNITLEQYNSLVEKLDNEQNSSAKSMKQYQDSIISAIKERYQKELDLNDKALKKKLDDLAKEKEATLKSLDEQLNAYKKYIDSRKKELQKEKEEDDYQKQINEHNKIISDYQNRIERLNKAAQSGDRQAIKERNDLEEKLAKEKEQLSQYQIDKERDLKLNALDDEYSKYEELIQKQRIDAENKYKTDTEYEQSKFDIKKQNIETLFARESELIIAAAELTKEKFSEAIESINTSLSQYGLNISPDLKSSIIDSNSSVTNTAALSKITDILGESNESNKYNDTSNLSSLNKYISSLGYEVLNKEKMVQLAKALDLNDITKTSQVGTDDIGRKNKNRIKEALINMKKSGAFFADGGRAKLISDTDIHRITGEDGLALVKNNEVILTPVQGNQIELLSKKLPEIIPALKLKPPHYDMSQVANKNLSETTVNINLPANTVINAADMDNWRSFKKEMIVEMKKSLVSGSYNPHR